MASGNEYVFTDVKARTYTMIAIAILDRDVSHARSKLVE
jgi:hypothetical protein